MAQTPTAAATSARETLAGQGPPPAPARRRRQRRRPLCRGRVHVPRRQRRQRRRTCAAQRRDVGLPRCRRNRSGRTRRPGSPRGGGRRHDADPAGGRPNAYADVRIVAGNRVFGGADAGISRFTVGPADLEAAAAFDIVHTGECSMLEGQLKNWPRRHTPCPSTSPSGPGTTCSTHAPDVSVAIWSPARREPGAKRRTRRAGFRDRGPVAGRDHPPGRRRCGAAARGRSSPYSPVGPGPGRGHPRAQGMPSSRGFWWASPARNRFRSSSLATPRRTPRRAAPRYGAFGHRTPITGQRAELNPIPARRLDLR